MIDYKTLTAKYGTPLYLYDFNHITTQYKALKDAFRARKSLICYAVKANSNLSIIKHLGDMGAGCDCVSIGEVRRALLAGVANYKIIFSGVGKTDSEITEALKADILMINLESEAELERVELQAKALDVKARISIRVNPNIDPKTHPYISTGLHENKFGVDLDTAKRMYIKAKNAEHLDPVGIHFHIGSQLTDLEPIRQSSEVVADLVRSLKAIKIDIKFFDIGGGLGIDYEGETLIKPYDYAQAILETLGTMDMTVICEPGRFLVGNAGEFVTKVLYEKVNQNKRFVIVDGAMNDLIRPSLYKAFHKVTLQERTEDMTKADIVGPVCESGDFFAKDIDFPQSYHDDLVVIKSAGAYCFTMSSNYNTRGRVAEVALEDGKDRLIRARETFEDMIQNEKDYLS